MTPPEPFNGSTLVEILAGTNLDDQARSDDTQNVPRLSRKVISQAAAAMSRMRKTYAGGRPPKLSACPVCGTELAARAMRAHLPTHELRAPGRPPALTFCPRGCGAELGARAMRIHLRTCEGKPARAKKAARHTN